MNAVRFRYPDPRPIRWGQTARSNSGCRHRRWPVVSPATVRGLPTLARPGQAACAPVAALFDDGAPAPDVARQMAALCARCPLLNECRTAALADSGASGFLGGMTAHQRRQHARAAA